LLSILERPSRPETLDVLTWIRCVVARKSFQATMEEVLPRCFFSLRSTAPHVIIVPFRADSKNDWTPESTLAREGEHVASLGELVSGRARRCDSQNYGSRAAKSAAPQATCGLALRDDSLRRLIKGTYFTTLPRQSEPGRHSYRRNSMGHSGLRNLQARRVRSATPRQFSDYSLDRGCSRCFSL